MRESLAQLDMENLPELPKGWVWAHASDVCSSVRDGTHDTPKYVNEGIPLITSKNLKENVLDFATTRNISIEDHEKISIRSGVENGDVLFAMIGTVGNPVVVRTDRLFSIKNVGLFKKNEAFLSPEYMRFWLASYPCKEILERKQLLKGTTQRFIPLEHLRILPIPLAPFPEQHRIVAKIEELLTRLDASVETLKKIKAQLRRYRQAVLKYALEGKLTTEWREAHKRELEPVSILLDRIKHEHQRSAKGKYKELPPLDTSDLPELPEGWVWARVGDIVETVEMTSPRLKPDKEFVYIDIASIDNREQKIVDPKRYTGRDAPSRARQLIRSGDILFSTVRTYLKNIAIVTDLYDGQIASTGFTVIRLHGSISSKLMFYYVQTDAFLNRLTQIQRGTSYPAVRDSDVFAQSFALIPPTEQRHIVEEIERRFSVADEIERTIDHSLGQAARLRQSILKRAFEGKLVPQDPNDEPAEKLLERVREDRAKPQATVQPAKVSRKRVTTEEMRLL